MTAKLGKQLAGKIFKHKQSLRARASERRLPTGASQPYLSGMLFLWQGRQRHRCFTLPVKQRYADLPEKRGSIEDEEWDRGP
jgi:hypothetical protein